MLGPQEMVAIIAVIQKSSLKKAQAVHYWKTDGARPDVCSLQFFNSHFLILQEDSFTQSLSFLSYFPSLQTNKQNPSLVLAGAHGGHLGLLKINQELFASKDMAVPPLISRVIAQTI